MRVREIAFKEFNSMLDWQLEKLSQEEKFLKYYNKGFELGSRLISLDGEIREIMFKIIFNQRLLEFLGKKIVGKNKPRNRHEKSPIRVFGKIIEEDLENISEESQEGDKSDSSVLFSFEKSMYEKKKNSVENNLKMRVVRDFKKSSTMNSIVKFIVNKAKDNPGEGENQVVVETPNIEKFKSGNIIESRVQIPSIKNLSASLGVQFKLEQNNVQNFLREQKKIRDERKAREKEIKKEIKEKKNFLSRMKRISTIGNSISNFLKKGDDNSKKKRIGDYLNSFKIKKDLTNPNRHFSFISLLGFKRLKESVTSDQLFTVIEKAVNFKINNLGKHYRLFTEKLKSELKPKKRKKSKEKEKVFDNFFLSMVNKDLSDGTSLSRYQSPPLLNDYDEGKIASKVKKMKKKANKKKNNFKFLKDMQKTPKEDLKKKPQIGNYLAINGGTEFVFNFTQEDAFYLILAFFYCLRNDTEFENYVEKINLKKFQDDFY